jgi:hypothetical protein
VVKASGAFRATAKRTGIAGAVKRSAPHKNHDTRGQMGRTGFLSPPG